MGHNLTITPYLKPIEGPQILNISEVSIDPIYHQVEKERCQRVPLLQSRLDVNVLSQASID